jgi:hypothetical protein
MIHVNIYLDKESSLYKSLSQKRVLTDKCFSIKLGIKPAIGETLRINHLNASDEKLKKFLSHKDTLYFKIDDIIQSCFMMTNDSGISILDLKCTVIEKPF